MEKLGQYFWAPKWIQNDPKLRNLVAHLRWWSWFFPISIALVHLRYWMVVLALSLLSCLFLSLHLVGAELLRKVTSVQKTLSRGNGFEGKKTCSLCSRQNGADSPVSWWSTSLAGKATSSTSSLSRTFSAFPQPPPLKTWQIVQFSS